MRHNPEEPVALADLIDARKSMIVGLIGDMPKQHREFLVGFEKGEPDWELLNVPHAKDLPAVLWRQANLNKLKPEKRAELTQSLEEILFGGTGSS